MENIHADYILILGDFNLWLDTEMDYKGTSKHNLSKSAQMVNTFLEESNWFDVWHLYNPTQFRFTFNKSKPKLMMSQLDYVMAPVNNVTAISECQILPAFLSDHCPAQLELILDSSIKEPGLWKFNTQHLKNPEYVKAINVMLMQANSKHYECDPVQVWEDVKTEIKEFTVAFLKKAACARHTEIQLLERQLSTCHKKLAMINLSSNKAVNIIQNVNDRIDQITCKLNEFS